MKLGIAILGLLACLSARAAEPLSTDEWKLEAAFIATMAIDYGQTRDIKNHPGMYERNPILGKHPSDAAIRNYFLIATAGHVGVTYVIPKEYRPYWQWGTLLLQTAVILHNQSIGLRVDF